MNQEAVQWQQYCDVKFGDLLESGGCKYTVGGHWGSHIVKRHLWNWRCGRLLVLGEARESMDVEIWSGDGKDGRPNSGPQRKEDVLGYECHQRGQRCRAEALERGKAHMGEGGNRHNHGDRKILYQVTPPAGKV